MVNTVQCTHIYRTEWNVYCVDTNLIWQSNHYARHFRRPTCWLQASQKAESLRFYPKFEFWSFSNASATKNLVNSHIFCPKRNVATGRKQNDAKKLPTKLRNNGNIMQSIGVHQSSITRLHPCLIIRLLKPTNKRTSRVVPTNETRAAKKTKKEKEKLKKF